MPVKDSHTRIKPFALASDHGYRYTRTDTFFFFFSFFSVGGVAIKFITVPLLKQLRLRNGRFASET
jgi:hypothetical protein